MADNKIDMSGGEPSIGKQLLFGLISSALGANISPPRGPSVAEQLAVKKAGMDIKTAEAEAKRKADAEKAMAALGAFEAREMSAYSAPTISVDARTPAELDTKFMATEYATKNPNASAHEIIDSLPKPRYKQLAKEIPQEGLIEQDARRILERNSDLDAVGKFNLAQLDKETRKGFANAPFALSAQSKSFPGVRDAAKLGQLFPGQASTTLPALASAVEKGQTFENTLKGYGIKSEFEKEQDRLEEEARDRRARIAADDKASIPKDEKPATVDQSKSALYALRMTRSDEDMRSMQQKGFDPSSIANVWYKPTWNNLIKDPVARRYAAAKRNFITAVLRPESGAAIAESEFVNEDQKYFPQTGDDAETVLFKDDMRLQTISGFKAAAGEAAYNRAMQQYEKEKSERAGTGITPPAPTVSSGIVVNGYRFKGGDKNNSANWEKIK